MIKAWMAKAAALACAACLALAALSGCAGGGSGTTQNGPAWDGLQKQGSMDLEYATQLNVDYYEGGYAFVRVEDGLNYVVVPENALVPLGLPEGTTIISQPVDSIYLAATSAMDLIAGLDSVDKVSFGSVDRNGWYIDAAVKAMDAGTLRYAGKYSAPDYETILSGGCDLALESTMIYHKPDVKEQLERVGIPVFVERSSYESNPLGRMEWIKLYGLILGKQDQAEKIFQSKVKQVKSVMDQPKTKKNVAFFSVSANGSITVRKSGDYLVKAIEMAGGTYVFSNLQSDGSATSTMSMQMESFYQGAKDADVLVYNSSIEGEIQSLDQLKKLNSLFADFKAFKSGDVWCCGKNMFQESLSQSDLIVDLHNAMSDDSADQSHMTYLKRLK